MSHYSGVKIFKLFPKAPYLITPHLEKFAGRDFPTPSLYIDGSCRRILYVDGVYIPYKVFILSEGGEPILEVKLFIDDYNLASKALNIVREIYRVDFDYLKFLEKCRVDGRLYHLARKYYGLRPTRVLDIYEALVDSIIEQNISLNLAMRIKGKFVRLYGVRAFINGEEYYSFPPPNVISGLNPLDLKESIRTTRVKAKAIIEVARLSGELPKVNEIDRDPDEFMDYITMIRGIGRWTAEISVAKVSKKFFVGPFGDLAVKRGFKRVLGIEDKCDMKKILRDLSEYTGLILYLLALEGHRRR